MVLRFFVAACVMLPAAMVAAAAQPSPETIGRIIDQAVAKVPPCHGLAVGATQGNVRAQRFFGETGNHGRPKADTEFDIGSITKTFTATLLAYEDQKGEMRLDDPLARYAPRGFHVPEFNGQQIRLVHLAEHTSGLPRTVRDPSSPMGPERLWRFTSHYRMTRAPGEKFLYSNLGFALLMRAIVRRTGETENALYTRIITEPLGLHDTALELTPAQRARLAQGYRQNGQPAPEYGPSFPAMNGSGGIHSTLNDMMHYLDFELGRMDVTLRSLLPVLHKPRHGAGKNGGIGLAWQMHKGPGSDRIIFKDGSMPGFASYMAFSPPRGTGVVVLSNQAHCKATKIGNEIMGRLNGGEAPDEPPSDQGD